MTNIYFVLSLKTVFIKISDILNLYSYEISQFEVL